MNEEEHGENSIPTKRVRHTPREEVEKLVAQYEKSGLTLKEFAARAGRKLGSLRSWVYHSRRRTRQKESTRRAGAGFATVEVKESVSSKATIHWPNGMAVELALDEASLIRVLRELTTPCSR
jgi:transposase-like protein